MKTYTIKPLNFRKLRGKQLWWAEYSKGNVFGMIEFDGKHYKAQAEFILKACKSLNEAKKEIEQEYQYKATKYMNEVVE